MLGIGITVITFYAIGMTVGVKLYLVYLHVVEMRISSNNALKLIVYRI
jgi:hypothetical protein